MRSLRTKSCLEFILLLMGFSEVQGHIRVQKVKLPAQEVGADGWNKVLYLFSKGYSLFDFPSPHVHNEPYTNDGWTFEETKVFETALCDFDDIALQAFCQHVAVKMPWKSIESIKHHYMSLNRDLNIIGSANIDIQCDQTQAGFSDCAERMEQLLFEASSSSLPNLADPKSLLVANSTSLPEAVDALPKTGPKTVASKSENATLFVSQKRSIDEALGDEPRVEDPVFGTKRSRGKERTSKGDAHAPEFEVVPKYAQQLGDSASLLVPEDISASLAAQSPVKAQDLISQQVVTAAFLQSQFYKENQEAITQNMASKKKVAELQTDLVKEKETALNAENIIACLKEQLKEAKGQFKMIEAMKEKVIAAQAERDSLRQELEGKLKDSSQELESLRQLLLKERSQFKAEKVELYNTACSKCQLDYLDVMAAEFLDFDFSKIGTNVVEVDMEFKATGEAEKAVEAQTEKAPGMGTGEDKNQEKFL